MLRELRVRNLAVVEAAELEFGPGLNVVTGETGAGKSLLVDALLLVRGARAGADAIRGGSDQASVQASFEVAPGSPARALLSEAGLEGGEGGLIVVRRELQRSGRHRAFVNDTQVTAALLDRLGAELLDIHGQHEHQRLLDPRAQLDLLDAAVGAVELRRYVAARRTAASEAAVHLDELRVSAAERGARLERLRADHAELERARVEPGEEERLRLEQRRLREAERIAAGLTQAGELLADGPDSARERLGRAARSLRDVVRVDPGLASAEAGIEASLAALEDALREIRRGTEGLVADPGTLEAVAERLHVVVGLKRRHGVDEDGLRELAARLEAELARLEGSGRAVDDAERRAAATATELEEAARALTAERAAGAPRLGRAIEAELRTLGMERARFELRLEAVAGPVGPAGREAATLMLAANPGEEPRPLARIASGGELARCMLAVAVATGGGPGGPTAVFDEVDAGVSGRVGASVAERLAQLARGRQVLCVTHLAVVAARADRHAVVAKSARGDRTQATVTVVTGAARTLELARMLGDGEGSAAALRHARELLLGGRPGRS